VQVVNFLDLLLIAMIALAAVTGHRLGLAARAVSWAGGLLGLVLAAAIVPAVLDAWPGGAAVTRLLIGLLVVLVTTSVLSGVGEVIGLRLRHRVHATPFGPIDRAAGGIAGGLSVLLLVWFLLPALATTPGAVSRQVRQSTVIGWVDQRAPDPPDASRALGRLIDRSGFPEVFADLQPAPVTGPPPEQLPVPADVAAAATPSTVNVEAFGCGSGFEGSGFVVRDGLVATNAHVVAGADRIRLRRTDGSTVPAQIHHFDPDRDLALLATGDVGRTPLPLREPRVDEGAAIIGYPGGQDTPRIAPGRVADDRPTVGRNLYGRDRVERRVLYLSAQLRQGDSGSAVIGADGGVVGVVFAVSPDNANTAYALHVEELREVLAATPNGSTGSCL
jgi:S1-C subfamily serine protease